MSNRDLIERLIDDAAEAKDMANFQMMQTMQLAADALERMEWDTDMEAAKAVKKPILLWMRAPFSRAVIAEWYEPWAVWTEDDHLPDETPYGIGSKIPTKWMHLPPE